MPEKRFTEAGFDSGNPEMIRLHRLVGQLLQFPRHLSQHVGGFVLTEDRLDETVPIHNAAMEDRTFIEWDKDDIDALGLMKVDVLSLGMRSEEHTSELQSLMRISYAVFSLKKTNTTNKQTN